MYLHIYKKCFCRHLDIYFPLAFLSIAIFACWDLFLASIPHSFRYSCLGKSLQNNVLLMADYVLYAYQPLCMHRFYVACPQVHRCRDLLYVLPFIQPRLLFSPHTILGIGFASIPCIYHLHWHLAAVAGQCT